MLPVQWSNPKLDYDNFSFFFNVKRKKESYPTALEAAKSTVEYIAANYKPPYTLFLSGGIDSQVMLYSWYISKVPFTTFCGVYNFNSNYYDITTLEKFANLYNIPITYYNIDVLGFLENEHDYYARKYFCGSPHITCYMKMSDMVNEGTTIFSGNILYDHERKFVTRNVLGLYHYSVLSGKSVVPYFLCETDEIAHSFDQNELDTTSAYDTKLIIYKKNGFPVIPQETSYNGFEKLKEHLDDENNLPRPVENIPKIWKNASQLSTRNFDLLYRNKYESMFIRHKYVHLC